MDRNMIKEDWIDFFQEEENKAYFKSIEKKIYDEYKYYQIYPKKKDVFRAFELTGLKEIKIVILGQDPYHGKNQADGLSFSVKNGVIAPSLRNIIKELESDYNLELTTDGNLETWAKQGVFLLNSSLTVRENEPNSHKDIGWSKFTDRIIQYININRENIVYILWGNYAKEKIKFIDESKNYIITSSHPSPFSARISFFGSKPFTKANEYLQEKQIKQINWLSIGKVIK